jgi:hypothetical protein
VVYIFSSYGLAEQFRWQQTNGTFLANMILSQGGSGSTNYTVAPLELRTLKNIQQRPPGLAAVRLFCTGTAGGNPQFRRLRMARKIVVFPKTRTIVTQGDPHNTLLHVQGGALKLAVISEDGKDAVIALLRASDFVTEGCISGDSPARTATATTMAPKTALVTEEKEICGHLHLVDAHTQRQD